MKKIIKAITLFLIIAIFSEVSYAAEYLNSVEFNEKYMNNNVMWSGKEWITDSYPPKISQDATEFMSVEENEESISIELSDNGNGVEEEELPNLFVSFYRGDVSRTKPNEGSGLGLAIAKNIVEAHGGKIAAYNVNGLTIKITLPKISDKESN